MPRFAYAMHWIVSPATSVAIDAEPSLRATTSVMACASLCKSSVVTSRTRRSARMRGSWRAAPGRSSSGSWPGVGDDDTLAAHAQAQLHFCRASRRALSLCFSLVDANASSSLVSFAAADPTTLWRAFCSSSWVANVSMASDKSWVLFMSVVEDRTTEGSAEEEVVAMDRSGACAQVTLRWKATVHAGQPAREALPPTAQRQLSGTANLRVCCACRVTRPSRCAMVSSWSTLPFSMMRTCAIASVGTSA